MPPQAHMGCLETSTDTRCIKHQGEDLRTRRGCFSRLVVGIVSRWSWRQWCKRWSLGLRSWIWLSGTQLLCWQLQGDHDEMLRVVEVGRGWEAESRPLCIWVSDKAKNTVELHPRRYIQSLNWRLNKVDMYLVAQTAGKTTAINLSNANLQHNTHSPYGNEGWGWALIPLSVGIG